MQHYDILENKRYVLFFIAIAYLFSIAARMYWPIHFSGMTSFYDAGQLMINTNDGYAFANAARDFLNGITPEDGMKTAVQHYSRGLVMLTAYITKITPFSLETVILYLPAVISSLIVVPIILVARLMGHTFLGFLAALLGAIAWSYYNRTMTGYYDTDMFSVLLQFSIFYGFLSIVYKKTIANILLTAFLITIYPYFYSQGVSIVYVVFIFTVGYLLLEYFDIISINETKETNKQSPILLSTVILLSITLMVTIPIEIRIVLFVLMFFVLHYVKMEQKVLFVLAGLFFFAFLIYGNIFDIILGKVASYVDRGVESKGLHFYQVIQTVREAGSIPMSTVAHRISGSNIGLLISLLGFVLLVWKHKPFIIALPLIGVGLFAYIGGLRFTVYAVPIAAISAVFLFYVVATYFKDKRAKIIFIILATFAMIYPNIVHIIEYKVPTVLNATEVADLKKLKTISSAKDYTIAWWDYGYPIWFYSGTNTLIDGGKHTKDNYIVSKILQTTSPELAARLSRIAVEKYVDSNYSLVAKTLFEDSNTSSPEILLSEIENGSYPLPEKTRDVYLYLPYRMLNIFPTVAIFGNIDLTTGELERKISFYPTQILGNKNGIIALRNGIIFDAQNGILSVGGSKKDVKYFIVTQNTKDGKTNIQSQLYHMDGEFVVVYMQSYGQFIVMDSKTFNSTYVQMFVLGKYDKNLFELVVSSAYSKIYKLKK